MNHRAEEIDLRTILRPVYEARIFIIVGILAGVALGTAAFFSLPRKFEASAKIVIIDQSAASAYSRMMGQFSGLVSALGAGGLGNSSYADEAVAVLNSRDLARRFLSSVGGDRVLFADEWSRETGQWQDPDDVPSEADVWEVFDKRVRSVAHDSKTGIVTLTIRLGNQGLVAEWAAAFIEMADQMLRERAIMEAGTRLEHLQARLTGVGLVELRQSINDLIEIELNKEMLASVGPQYAYRIIDSPVVPDMDDYVSPNLLLLGLAGALIGMVSGFALHRFSVVRSGST